MSGLDDFMTGLKAFDDGVTQYATGQAIMGAKDQMDQLNQSAMNEMERRASLEKLSKGLTMQLGGLGAPVSQIQTAVGALAPKALGTPGAALWEGMQTGSTELQDLGKQGLDAEAAPKLAAEKRSNAFDMEKLKFQRETALMEAGLRAEAKGKDLKPLSPVEVATLSSGKDYEQNLAEVRQLVKDSPWLVGKGRMISATSVDGGLKKLADFESLMGRMSDTYQKLITGTGAGKEESARYLTRQPQPGDWTTSGFTGRLDASERIAKRQMDNFKRTLKIGKRDLSAMDETARQQEAAPKREVVGDQVWELNSATGKYRRVK